MSKQRDAGLFGLCLHQGKILSQMSDRDILAYQVFCEQFASLRLGLTFGGVFIDRNLLFHTVVSSCAVVVSLVLRLVSQLTSASTSPDVCISALNAQRQANASMLMIRGNLCCLELPS